MLFRSAPEREFEPCDRCGDPRVRLLVEADELHHATGLCIGCGLVRAVGVDESFDLERFYEDEFTGDAGGAARLLEGGISARQRLRQEARALKSLAQIRELVTLRGLRVLDLRCRSGALAAAMREAGAEVCAIDLIPENIAATRERSARIDARLVDVDTFETLAFLPAESVDLVTGLTIHVAAHLPHPRRFFESVARVMRPGAKLVLDEKNILRCERLSASGIFDTGRAHFYHFSAESLAGYLSEAGLSVIHCGDAPERRSSFRHLLAVAEKPAGDSAPAPAPVAPRIEELLAELDASQRRLGRRRLRNAIRRRARKMVKAIRGQR